MKYEFLHLCIRVMDLEKSLRFYEEALGFQITRRKDYPKDGFSLVFLADQRHPFELELTYNYDQKEPYEIGNGYSHFAVSVDDLKESHRQHKEAGYPVTDLGGLSDQSSSFYFITDPDGYDIEIIQSK